MTVSVVKVHIGTLSDFPMQLGKTVEAGTLELAVFQTSQQQFKAIENRCPHKGGVLAEGMVSGDYVFCPMHDWKIDLSSGNVQAPDDGCVKTYETLVEGNEVFVLLPS
ncbi:MULTISPECIES: nitrite reductase small subunit NirD [Bacillus]|uniref:Nitrite reductase n=1 Tax=Bacillus pumilus (strain SAFR-032) TaxID=315750 RepID=A8FE14_BACP2|nr:MULTISPECIES: nitrite reductase small subunit NirD [Bacillus]ABV62481.1 nitrite reductase [Bacillus pumilus SAFR-032]AVI41232.1 nitrite reductase (NAD(P)H) small subunit [Bacillus pumilus]MBC3644606.1 nitrite reductase small subunit NirD [Bacillus pumilus]MBC3648214.1 nitrite reductase small subunit NirD [Bacillus pumilus]MBC3651802.1 nitrite reductase small subunit NirD [Bacillus pumilus]